MTDLEIVRDVVVAEESPIVHLPSAQEIIDRDAEMPNRRVKADQHHHKDVWTKDPHSSTYQKVDSGQQSEDSASETTGEIQSSFGPTSNAVGNHMTQAARQLIEDELKGVGSKVPDQFKEACPDLCRSSLDFPPQRINSCPEGEPAALDSLLQDPGCEHYTWRDQGEKVLILIDMMQLGADKPFVKVEFGYQTVGIEVSYSGRLRYKLKIPKLFAPISWELCRWTIQKDILNIELVKIRPEQEWKKLHGRMIFERVVPLHSVSESIVQLQKFKLLAEPQLFSRSDSTAYIMSLFNKTDEEELDEDDLQVETEDQKNNNKQQYENALDLMRVGKYMEALQHLEQFVGCLHMEHDMLRFALFKIAECHKECGNFKRALECLSWVIQRHSCEVGARALLMRASLYEETERPSLAVLDAKMVLMFDKHNSVALGMLRRLQYKE